MSADRNNDRCAGCSSFRNDPETLEAAFAGLTSLSSAYASVRADDGLCVLHDRYLGADSWCKDFTRRERIANSG